MKQETIIILKATRLNLERLNESLRIQKEEFNDINQDLLANIEKTKIDLNECMDEIKITAIDEFKETGEKKLLGGIGIRVLSKIDYSELEAINWAKDNMPVAIKEVLDKKQFDTFAKSSDLDFVTKSSQISVTFPKEIKL